RTRSSARLAAAASVRARAVTSRRGQEREGRRFIRGLLERSDVGLHWGVGWKEQVVISDVGDAYDQHAHAAPGPVDHAGRDVHQGALVYRMLDAVQHDGPRAVEDVVEFGGPLVIMLAGAVDVHGVRPGSHVLVLPADQQVAPAAGTALPGRR